MRQRARGHGAAADRAAPDRRPRLAAAAATTIGVAIVAIGVPTVLAFVRERPGTRTADGRGQLTGATVGEGLRDYRFWILVVVLFAISIAQNGAITHLSALLTDRGIPPERAAIAVSAIGGAALLGRLATGWLIDRFFAPLVSFVLLAMAALGTFLLSSASRCRRASSPPS